MRTAVLVGRQRPRSKAQLGTSLPLLTALPLPLRAIAEGATDSG